MVAIVWCLVGVLMLLTFLYLVSKQYGKAFLCFIVYILITAAWIGVGHFIDKTIQVEETVIATYQLESVEQVKDVCYLVKPENGKKEYIEAENVETIKDLACTHPYMQVYQVTQKSSLSPIILGIIYLDLQHGSSTTMRYEITISPYTVEYIQKASY